MKKRRDPTTRLDAFMLKNGLRPSQVAREAGVARQHLLRIRAGTADPGIATATRIRNACARLLKRRVSIFQLFDLRERPPADRAGEGE